MFFVHSDLLDFVIGHQLEIESFNSNKYAVLEGTIAIAYMVAGISLCAAAVYHCKGDD